VAVLGFGVTGQAVSNFLREREIDHEIFDEDASLAPLGIKLDFQPTGEEIVIYGPGFIHSQWLCRAREVGCRCLSELDLAQFYCANRTVAVTGTNGKTSTVHLLAHVLENLGEKCVLTGNVGAPVIGQISTLSTNLKLWNICEVSSFQAYSLEYFRPEFVLWTNFSENHLDVHRDLGEYWEAKWRLLRRCVGFAAVGRGVARWAEKFSLPLPSFAVVPGEAATPKCGFLAMAHQRQNYFLVEKFLQFLGFSPEKISGAAENFKTPPHRLWRWGTVGGVEIWEDSKATTAAAALAALRHVTGNGKPCLWIVCGHSKGEDLKNFHPAVSLAGEILCFGEIAPRFQKFFAGEGKISTVAHRDQIFEKIDDFIRRQRKKSASILFSPGFSSFDLFRNYGERGDWFLRGMAELRTRGRSTEE
jgi:UDP-N-acetylmuramoylalanine--D-glutamate ligase